MACIQLYTQRATVKRQRGAPSRCCSSFLGTNWLIVSSYFEAQTLRWPDDTADSSTAPGSPQQPKPLIKITLPDASYEPAAMAVLQSLYVIQTHLVERLLSALTDQQLVQAAVLADMWEVPAVGEAAMRLLTEAANSDDGLHSSAGDELLSTSALPDCLQPLLRHVVLGRFGDLHEAWTDPITQEALLKLPLHAMVLLLSSNQLKAPSEDTVLCTARIHAHRLKAAGHGWQALRNSLAPLVRCRHLSKYQLQVSVLSSNTQHQLLGGLLKQLKHMLLLQLAAKGTALTASFVSAGVPDAPASWLLPARPGRKHISSAQTELSVDVAAIRAAAQEAARVQQDVVVGRGPLTAPVMGICGGLRVSCKPQVATGSKRGSVITVYAFVEGLPPDASCNATYSLECVGFRRPTTKTRRFDAGRKWGYDDFFSIKAMSGGWDEAVWAAKGLPTAGELVFRLIVSNVGQ